MSNISPLSTAAVTPANKPSAKSGTGATESGNSSAKSAAAPTSSAILSLSAEGLNKAAADSGKDATPSSARA